MKLFNNKYDPGAITSERQNAISLTSAKNIRRGANVSGANKIQTISKEIIREIIKLLDIDVVYTPVLLYKQWLVKHDIIKDWYEFDKFPIRFRTIDGGGVSIRNMLELRRNKLDFTSDLYVKPDKLDNDIWDRFTAAYKDVECLNAPTYVIRELLAVVFEPRMDELD
jgi:hypothetical protein